MLNVYRMGTIKLYTGFVKRLYYFLLGVFLAGMAAGSALFLQADPGMAWHGDSGPAYGIVACILLACAGIPGAYFIWTALEWRPKLVISEEGLFIQALGGQPIRWQDITAVDLRTVIYSRSSHYDLLLQLKVCDPEFRYTRRGPIPEGAPPDGSVMLYEQAVSDLTMSKDKVLRLIYARLAPDVPRPPINTAL